MRNRFLEGFMTAAQLVGGTLTIDPIPQQVNSVLKQFNWFLRRYPAMIRGSTLFSWGSGEFSEKSLRIFGLC